MIFVSEVRFFRLPFHISVLSRQIFWLIVNSISEIIKLKIQFEEAGYLTCFEIFTRKNCKEKIKNKSYLFLQFNWSMFFKIGCFFSR